MQKNFTLSVLNIIQPIYLFKCYSCIRLKALSTKHEKLFEFLFIIWKGVSYYVNRCA